MSIHVAQLLNLSAKSNPTAGCQKSQPSGTPENRYLFSFDEAQQKNKDYRTNRRYDKGANQPTARGYTQGAKQKPAKDCTHHTHDNIADDAKATTLHKLTREPASRQTYQNEPDEFHGAFLP
jgi:hypothetical protein